MEMNNRRAVEIWTAVDGTREVNDLVEGFMIINRKIETQAI
jgi:hypothetical protein